MTGHKDAHAGILEMGLDTYEQYKNKQEYLSTFEKDAEGSPAYISHKQQFAQIYGKHKAICEILEILTGINYRKWMQLFEQLS